ncbi:MAG: hypothetical protein ACOCTU_05820 [Bacteroidota bacterium]
MELKDLEDFSPFLYDPSRQYTLEQLKKSHMDFQASLPEGPERLPNNRAKVLRYIILVYDMNSPLRRMFPSFLNRKKEAAIMAGFKLDKKTRRFNQEVEDIISGYDKGVNKMIVRYVMYFYNHKYLQLVVFNEVMGQLALQKMGTTKITGTDMKAFTDMGKSIESLNQEIFGGDETQNVKKELHRLLEEEVEDLRPDIMAQEIHNNPELFKDMDNWLQ